MTDVGHGYYTLGTLYSLRGVGEGINEVKRERGNERERSGRRGLIKKEKGEGRRGMKGGRGGPNIH